MRNRPSPCLMSCPQTTHAMSDSSSSWRSANGFCPQRRQGCELSAEPTENCRRQLHVGDLMIRLLRERLAGRLDLGAPDTDLVEKRRQHVNALRSAYQNRSHVVFGAAQADGIYRRRRMDTRTLPATDMEGDRRLAGI